MSKYQTTDIQAKKIANNFRYHTPKDDQIPRYTEIRAMGHNMASRLTELCPESRELALALTKLEEAIMWANAAIARNEE